MHVLWVYRSIEVWFVLVFGAHTLPSCVKVLLTLRCRQRLRYSQ